MNQLVIMHGEQAVTSSLQVAETFDKNHRDVLKAIDDLKEGVAQNFADLFQESHYVHDQNKQTYRMYFMNRDGFTLLAMGFTGGRALEFKMAYINAFNQLEAQMRKPMDSTKLLLMAALEQEERIESVEGDIKFLKDTMRIDGSEQFQLNAAAKKKVIEALGGTDSKAYKEIGRKAFRQIWGEFKKYFQLPRYSELPKAKFGEGLTFIEEWTPDTALRMDIKKLNSQQTFLLMEGGAE